MGTARDGNVSSARSRRSGSVWRRLGALGSRAKCLLLAIAPSWAKIRILRSVGHTIGSGCSIGCTYLDVGRLNMGDDCHIASWNYIRGLAYFEMGEHARIGGGFNWITASARHRTDANTGHGVLVMGSGANITGLHYLDVQRAITIGSETLVAGHGTTIWTHAVEGLEPDDVTGVRIGSQCYVGGGCTFVQGSSVGDRSIVGAGSVVTKDLSQHTECLVAGNPAVVKRHYGPDHPFWSEEHSGFLPKDAD